MSPALRGLLLLLVLAGLTGLGWLLARDPEPPPAHTAPRQWISSQECAGCHAEVAAEWQGSHHQISYLNEEVRRLSEDFRNKECQACHLPRPVFQTGLLQRTLPRVTRPDEGVDCLSCHLGPNGEILGRNSSEAGCQPRADPDVIAVKLCETCHNQHQTTDQWRASPQAAAGTSCNDCHMPEVTRADGRIGFDHRYLGAHDTPTLQSAGTFDLEVVDGVARVTLANTGAGHNFPTEERHRAVDMVLRFVDEEGNAGEWDRLFRFRQPYRDEPGENTQLPAGQDHTEERAVPAGTARVEARLWYRLDPFATDEHEHSTLLFERQVDLR